MLENELYHINTAGGAFIHGNVYVYDGDFVGRDKWITDSIGSKIPTTILLFEQIYFILAAKAKDHFLYLAQTPLSEADWKRVMDGQTVIKKDELTIAKTNISLIDISKFLQQATNLLILDSALKDLGYSDCNLELPSRALLEECIKSKNRCTIPLRKQEKPCLTLINNASTKLYDLLGIVYQFCEDENGYWLIGGSYKSPEEDFVLNQIPIQTYTINNMKSDVWGFRPLLKVLQR